MMGCRRRFTGAPLKHLTIASGRRPLVALLLLAAAVAALVSTPGIHAQSSGALTCIPLSARELGPAFDVTHPDHDAHDAHAVHSVGAITVTSAEPGGAIQEYLDSADVRLTAGGTGTFATRDLAVGKNPFKIKAMLGRDVSTYTLMVTPTASPKLTALAVADAATSNAVTLSPAFVSDTDFYTAKVGRNLAQITFTPTVSAGSAVEYLTMGSGGTFQDHADDDTNITGYQVDLNGEDSTTLVRLKVTNESEEKIYEVVVLRTDATVVWSAVATLGANEADPPTFFGQGGFGDLPADDRGALEGAGQFDFSSRTYEYAGFYYNDSDSTAAILLNNKGASTDPFRDTKALLRWFVYDSSFGFGDATNPNIAGSNVEYRWTGSDVSFSWEQGQRVALWITEHPPEVSVSANAASVTESVADTIITFTLTPEPQLATPLAVTVNVSETGGDYVTAANESDRTETIPANTVHVEFNVTVAAGNNAWDAHSTIIASIVPNSAAYTIKAGEGSTQTVVLDDDNPAGVVTIGAGSSTQSVTEGLPVTAIVTATTTGDQEPHKDFTASVVADELATPQATAGVDFTADTFAITFPGNTGLHGTNWKRAEVSVWAQTMQVTVVTAQDTIDEPHEAFRVYLEAISAPFTKGTPDTVTITLKDAAPGVTVDPVELTIAEGAIKTYIVVLNTKPTGDVTVAITGHAGTDLTLSGDTLANDALTFTTGNWNTAQTVTVTAVEDDDAVADGEVTLTHTASGGDYGSVAAKNITVTITENDTAGLTVDSASLTVTEGGAKDYTVRLDSEPTADVTVAITGHARTDLTLSGATLTNDVLTFTADNWNTAQTVTVTAVEDDDAVADGEVTLTHTASGGGYGSVAAKTVTVTITENDTAGMTIDPASLTVTEGGAKDYAVRMDSEPTADVTVAITGHTGTDLTLSDDTLTDNALTFTTYNWNAAQTVTVSAAEDDDAAADADVTLTHTSSGGGYGSVAAKTVTVTITENDTAGLTIYPASLTVTEGEINTYTVRLDSEPTADVTVAITGHTGTDLALSGATLTDNALTFTTDNWNTAQTVTVSAAEDADATADPDVTLTHTPSGGDYGIATAQTVTVAITENDTEGLTIDPASLTVTESGANTYTVRLDSEPTADVTVAITGHTGTDLTLSGGTLVNDALTFTTDNWNAALTVTVSAAEDADASNDPAVILTHTAGGGGYGSVATKIITVTITENDTAGVTIDPASLTVTEGGAKDYTVRLDSEPTADVTVAITGHGGTDLTLSGATLANEVLTFTTDNWNTAQAVTVTAVEDADAAADADVTLTHTAGGGGYGSAAVKTVTVTITENDTSGMTIYPTSLTVTEGQTNTYTVRLDSEPTANVTVAITGHTGTDLALSGATLANDALTFTTDNWNTAQTVTVTAATDDDAVADGEVTLTHTASGGDYGSAAVRTVTVTITENDTAGLTIDPASLTVTEGGAKNYTVRLDSEPTADVTVAITGHTGTDLALSGATLADDALTFTTGNWNRAQTVTVSAAEDADATADADVTLTHTASGGGYGSAAVKTVTVTIKEYDDQRVELILITGGEGDGPASAPVPAALPNNATGNVPGVSVSPSEMTVTKGATGTYTVVLNSRPSSAVTISVNVPAGNDISANPLSLTFSTGNWSTPQMVTVSAAEGSGVQDGSAVTITHSPSGGGYDSARADSVTVAVKDNHPPGVTISPIALTIQEGNSADYTVALDSQPAVPMTIICEPPANTGVSASPATLTFTKDDWDRERTITVSAAKDAAAVAGPPATLVHHVSGSTEYATLTLNCVTVTTLETDTQGVIISPTALTVAEGSSNRYTVALNSQPTGPVTVYIDGHSGTELTLSTTTLTFTAADWDTGKTVAVTARQDADTIADPAVSLVHTVRGADYEGIAATNLVVTIKRDDSRAPVTVGPIRPDASVASPLPTPEITIRWAGSDPALVIDEGGELVVEVSRSAGWDDVLTGVRLEITDTGNVLHYQVLMTNRDGEYVSVDLPLAPPLELDFPNTGLSTMTMKLALYTKDENVDEDDSEVTFKLLPDTRHPKRYTVGDADAVTITVRDNDAPDLAPTATPEPALSPTPKIAPAATTESTPEPTPTPAATLQPTPPPVPPAAPAETDSEDPPLTPAVMLVLLLLPLALVAWLIRRWWRRRR